MRFLLGMSLGAAAVLLLAGTLSGPGELRDRLLAAATAAEGWLRSAVHSDDPPRSGAPDDGTGAPSGAEPGPPLADLEPAGQPMPRPPDPWFEASRRKRAETATPIEGAAPAPATPAAPPESVAHSASGEAAAPAETAPPDVPPEAEQEPLPAALAATHADVADIPGLRSENVWVPFRSRTSARGFATRLSESIDHPFHVVRRGPGRYQVVFAYADEPERRSLLAQAAEATGLPL